MADCESLAKCPFFNDRMINMPCMANVMKKKYCHGDNSECARYVVFSKLGRENVPTDLFPHQTERVQEILKNSKIESFKKYFTNEL